MSQIDAQGPIAELLARARAHTQVRRLRSVILDHSLLRNSVLIMIATGLSAGLGYLFWLVVAHSFSASEVGVAAALITAMMLIAAIAELGTTRSLIQRLPRLVDDRARARTLSASALTGVAGGFAIALVAALLVLPNVAPELEIVESTPWHALLFAAGVALWGLGQIADHVFIAEREAGKMMLRNLVLDGGKIPIVIALGALFGYGALEIYGAWVAALALSLGFAYALLFPRLTRRIRLARRGVVAELRALRSMFAWNYVITLASVLPSFLLPILVLARLGAEANAYFYVTWLVGGLFFMISMSVSQALFAEGSSDPAQLPQTTRSAAKILGSLDLPLMAAFGLLGGWVLGLFGAGYESEGHTLLLLLTASAPFDATVGIFVARLRAEERLRVPAVLNVTLAAVAVAGAWVLMPSLELDGVGLAWAASRIAGSLFVLAYAWWRMRAGAIPERRA